MSPDLKSIISISSRLEENAVAHLAELSPANTRGFVLIRELSIQTIRRIYNPSMQVTNSDPNLNLETNWEQSKYDGQPTFVYRYNVAANYQNVFSASALIDARRFRDPLFIGTHDQNRFFGFKKRGQPRIYVDRIQIRWKNDTARKPLWRFADMTTEDSEKQNGLTYAICFWAQTANNNQMILEQFMIDGNVYEPNDSVFRSNSNTIEMPFADEGLTIPLYHSGRIDTRVYC